MFSDVDILTSLIPLFIVLKPVGFVLFPIKQLKNCDNIQYFSFVNFLTHCFHIYFIFYGFKNTIPRLEASDTRQKAYALVFFANTFGLIGVNLIWDKLQNRKFLYLLRQFYKIDLELRKSNIYLNYKKIQGFSGIVIFSEFLLYTYFNIDTFLLFLKIDKDAQTVVLNFVFYQGLHIMQVTMTAKCLILFLVIEKIFENLNFKLSSKNVQKIRNLYQDTYNLTVLLNRVLALQILVPFCITFVMVVFHIYYQIVDSKLQASVTVLVWLSTMLAKIVVVIVQIHRATLAVISYFSVSIFLTSALSILLCFHVFHHKCTNQLIGVNIKT